IILLSYVVFASSQDWCNTPWCPPDTHVGCNHDGSFHPGCRRPAAVNFTAANIEHILNRHNTLRSLTAVGHTLGRDGNLPTAVRMAQIRWDPTLAHLASLNARRCQVVQDRCRNTDEFNFSGQNLGTSFFLGNIGNELLINTVIDLWFNQRVNTLTSDINNIVPGRLFDVGHFSTLVNERQTHVGCGGVFYDQDSGGFMWRVGLLACNYAFSNIGGMSVYRTGAIGSECVLGTDDTFPGLCTLDEPINPNE
ncbi:Antigen 5 like allergen Cul n 1, partial [Pseudolycoriella hygida]